MATTNKAFRVKSGLVVEGGVLYPAAGTTAIAPLVFTSGTNLTSATAGAMEYDGTNFYLTPTAGSRKTIAFLDSNITGSAGSVANSLTLKADSGTTEGTDLYTFNGSSAKTLNIVAGTNITITKSAGSWTIAAAGSGSGTVTSVSVASANGFAGTVANSTTTPAITLSTTVTGLLSGNGTAISAASAGYGDTTNPYDSKTANYVLASPNGSAGSPTFRALVAADIPTLGNITNAGAIGSTAGLMVKTTTSGVLTTLAAGTSGQYLQHDGTWSTPPNWYPTTFTWTNGTTAGPTGSLTGTGMSAVSYAAIPSASATTSGVVTTNAQTFAGAKTFSGAVTFSSTVTVPTPVNATDAATKAYVDGVSSGINPHDAVKVATTTTLAAVYAAGTAGADGGTGVGATITFSATGTTTLDTSVTLALNDRVLVKDGVTADAGSTSKANGIYYVSTAGTTGVATVLTRAFDADNSIAGDITAGDLVYVLSGSTNGTTQWVQTATGTSTNPVNGIKIGTDAITYTQFSGASATTAGAGLSASGNVFNVGTASTSRIVVNTDNIDLATVSFSAGAASGTATSFVTGVTVDSYGRTTATSSSTVPTATSSVLGLASFGSEFTVAAGAVSVNSIAFSKITGTVPTTQGGTGLTSFTSGGALYATSTSALTTGTLPVSAGGTGITSFGTGIATFLGTPSSANLAAAVTDETGTGALVFAGSPALTGTVTLNAIAGRVTASGSTTGTTALTMSSIYDRTVYNGGEFIVKATNGTNIEITKILVVTDGSNVYVTNYGDVYVSSSIVTVDFSYSTNNVNMVVTPVAGTTGTTSVKVSGTLIAV